MLRTILPLVLLGMPWMLASHAQDSVAEKQEIERDYRAELARVNDRMVTEGELKAFLRRRFPNQDLTGPRFETVRDVALDHLVKRKVIFDFLEEKGYLPNWQKIDIEWERLKGQAEKRELTMETLAQQQYLTLEHWRFEITWKLGWEEYLRVKLRDRELAAYFEKNRQRLDGSKMEVSQIFLKAREGVHGDSTGPEKSLTDLREAVLGGDMEWEDAVRTHSEAPSRNDGGKVGIIGVDGPMDPIFTEQAFRLSSGEVSRPFQSAFGWHLIRCERIIPGKMGFRDNYEAIRQAALEDRFEALYQYQLPKVKLVLKENR